MILYHSELSILLKGNTIQCVKKSAVYAIIFRQDLQYMVYNCLLLMVICSRSCCWSHLPMSRPTHNRSLQVQQSSISLTLLVPEIECIGQPLQNTLKKEGSFMSYLAVHSQEKKPTLSSSGLSKHCQDIFQLLNHSPKPRSKRVLLAQTKNKKGS